MLARGRRCRGLPKCHADLRCRAGGRLSRGWQCQCETRAMWLNIMIIKPARVGLRDRAARGEAKSRAGGLGSAEGHEQMGRNARGDPKSAVTDADLDIPGTCARGAHQDLSRLLRLSAEGLDRVTHQIEHDMLYLRPVDQYLGQREARLETEADRAGFGV